MSEVKKSENIDNSNKEEKVLNMDHDPITIVSANETNSDDANIVWESRLDKVYYCAVTRLNERTGTLKVLNEENKKVILEKEVGLSYGAIFGPDIDDVMEWQALSTQAVDNQ